MSHRKKPFSHKQKKQQLLEKRAKKRGDNEEEFSHSDDDTQTITQPQQQPRNKTRSSTRSRSPSTTGILTSPVQETRHGASEQHRLVSVFAKESPEVLQKRKEACMVPLKRLPVTSLEVGLEDLYPSETYIPIPQRPNWNYNMTKEQVESQEELVFQTWLKTIYATHDLHKLSYFEHNLNVWRQLWRVVEVSDVILFVADVRCPVLHFPPSLFEYVTKVWKTPFVLVLNKMDLVDKETFNAWTEYFKKRFEGIQVVGISCYDRDAFLDKNTKGESNNAKRRRRKYVHATGVVDLLRSLQKLHITKRDGSRIDWEELIKKYDRESLRKATHDDEEEEEVDEDVKAMEELEESQGRRNRWKVLKERKERKAREKSKSKEANTDKDTDTDETESELESDSEGEGEPKTDSPPPQIESDKTVFTIGTIGHPNVGKSTLINSILGRKRVSTSRTPGHTKHFQTIHLSKDVRLCDCPGLVFPALLPKPLQILSGMYKIAQVPDPYTSVNYLAERVPLEKILDLKPLPEDDDDDRKKSSKQDYEWTTWNICEAFAIDRGFLTARAGRPDAYRAANFILRMVNDGKILLSFKPPGFFAGKKTGIEKKRDDEGGSKKGNKAISRPEKKSKKSKEDTASESESEKEETPHKRFQFLSLEEDA